MVIFVTGIYLINKAMCKFKIYIFPILFLVIVLCSGCSKVTPPYTLMFYNVENLFDTVANPLKLDYDFLPDGPKEWNSERYFKKLDDLAKVIAAVDSINLPVIVGVCEIENDTVLNDLSKRSPLKKANYQVIWDEGPDARGIDCALLYNPSVFKINSYEYLGVGDPSDFTFVTRDILYVNGSIQNEVFHVFVNHWPSRRGGADDSTPKRVLAANVLRHKVDEIINKNQQANIIIMGDMNDEPGDLSLTDILVALPNNSQPSDIDLVNLMYDEYEAQKGSYSYRGKWDMIDNVVVSGYLINKQNGLRTTLNDGHIFHQPFMEYVNERGEVSPNRTYGRTYFGGISDHFPVYLTIDLN